AAAPPACCVVGLQTRRTSASRTARKACRWNRELKPLPMKPTPRRLTGITLPPSPALSRVRDAQLRERLRRAALPLGDERVADVAQVLHAQLARVESRSREIAEAVEEGDARRVLGLRLLRPCDIVQQRGEVGVGTGEEGMAVAVVALVIDPGEATANRRQQVRYIAQQHSHEL